MFADPSTCRNGGWAINGAIHGLDPGLPFQPVNSDPDSLVFPLASIEAMVRTADSMEVGRRTGRPPVRHSRLGDVIRYGGVAMTVDDQDRHLAGDEVVVRS